MIHLLGTQGFGSVKFEIDTTGDGSFLPVQGTYNGFTTVGIWPKYCMFLFDQPLENVYQLKMYITRGTVNIIIANAILYGSVNNTNLFTDTAYELLITPIAITGDNDATNLATGVTYADGVYTLTDQQVTVSTDSQISTRPVFQMFYDDYDVTRTVLDQYNAINLTDAYVQIGFPQPKLVSMIHLLGTQGFGSVKFEIDTTGDGSFLPVQGTYNGFTTVGIWPTHCMFLFDQPLENVYQLKMYITRGTVNIMIANAILYGKQ
jgi:hypothetical protein